MVEQIIEHRGVLIDQARTLNLTCEFRYRLIETNLFNDQRSTDAEMAALLARRQELYEIEFPETKAGVAQAAAANAKLGRGAQNARDVGKVKSFASDVASATGKHPASTRQPSAAP
jgi:hypothetical protein